MTLAKAKAVAAAAVDSGLVTTCELRDEGNGEWSVRARANDLTIAASQAASLAASQAVTASVADVKFL